MAETTTTPFVLLVQLLLFFSGAPGGRCDVEPVCDGNSGPPTTTFPSLPQQFSTTVQAVVQDSTSKRFNNASEISVREYFDEIGNRGRLEYAFNGSAGYVIFDYDLREVFYIDQVSSDCFVNLTTPDNPTLNRTFGFRVVDGAPHIGTVSQYFQINNDSNITYIGPTDIRGIPCNQWRTCYVSDNKSYTIDYYFTREDWISAYLNDPVPVQIVLNGTKQDYESGKIGQLTNIYTFVDFNSGTDSVPDEVFTVPQGLACRGRLPGTSLPQFPQFFSASIESVFEETKYILVRKEYYDTVHQLLRRDLNNIGRQNSDLPPSEYTHIYDYNLETEYTINRRYRNCSISALEPIESFDTEVIDGRAALVSPADLFLVQDSSQFTYEGVTTVRGVEVDSWISFVDFKQFSGRANGSDIIEEVYFTRPDWNIYSNDPDTLSPILWRIKFSGNISYINDTTEMVENVMYLATHDMFGFSKGEPDLDVFDTSVCFGPSDYVIVFLRLPVKDISVDFSLLPRNTRAAFSSFTKVKPLQIGNIQVLGGNETELILSLHISNLSSISLPYVESPVYANQAAELLQKSAEKSENSQLEFGICLSTEGCQKSNPILSYVRNANGTTYHFIPRTTSDSNDDILSDGAIAGIVVWMFIVGVGLGVIGTLGILALIPCLRKRSFRLPSVSYTKHQDEKVAVEAD